MKEYKKKRKNSKNTWTGLRSNIKLGNYVGFVYEIVEKKTSKKYIGIKKFWTKKGRETNWRTYQSSSGVLKGYNVNDKRKFTKRIIKLCKTITELKTTEAWMQLDYYMSGKWEELFNEVINIRLRIRK